ncbi:maleylpyruvate isomerase N-terminal domain-containing protein, partial [Nocardioides plantarum]
PAGLPAALAALPPDVPVPSPLGPVAPAVVAEIRVLEAVVHGWDLGQALGVAPDLGAEADLLPLVEAADRLRAGLAVSRPDSTALGTPVEAAPGASALERVAARLGRRT